MAALSSWPHGESPPPRGGGGGGVGGCGLGGWGWWGGGALMAALSSWPHGESPPPQLFHMVSPPLFFLPLSLIPWKLYSKIWHPVLFSSPAQLLADKHFINQWEVVGKKTLHITDTAGPIMAVSRSGSQAISGHSNQHLNTLYTKSIPTMLIILKIYV